MMRPPMRMRCWTQRNQDVSDIYGGGSDWRPHLSEEPCYWWVQTGRQAVSETRTVVVAEEHLFVAHGCDIRPGDRVTKVVDHKGRVVFDADADDDPFRQVEHVADDRDFFDVSLARVG